MHRLLMKRNGIIETEIDAAIVVVFVSFSTGYEEENGEKKLKVR